MAEETGTIPPGRLKYGQQKASFSDTLNKFKANTSARRRTATNLITSTFTSSASLSSSSSYTKIAPQQEQPQPTPHQSVQTRIPRSSSFFNRLNTFVPRGATSYKNKESDIKEPNRVKQPSKITDRYPPTTSFSNSVPPQQVGTEPLIPKRKSNTQITQRALMQPISNPPLPRRNTIGNLMQKPSTHIPRFMRPTSSSSARRSSGPVLSKNHGPTKTATPNKPRSRLNGQIPPPPNFALPSASRLHRGTVQPSTTPFPSPKVSFEQSEQSERPKLDINSKLTFDQLLRSITPEEETERISGESSAIEETSDEPTTPEPPYVPNPGEITTAKPNAYWAGRMTVLSDRFRTETLGSPSSSTHGSDMHDDTQRLRRVFSHLRGLCTTSEAIDSLEAFHRAWAMRERGREGGMAAAHEVYGGSSSGGGKK
ncbi:hypothetical protein MMC29_006497, partial [Sticta canariensis]|nr:hypothetical protein [Sticta canariensis]